MLERRGTIGAVGLARMFEEVGAEGSHTKSAEEVVRMVLLAEGVHHGAGDGARAVSADGDALLLQKV